MISWRGRASIARALSVLKPSLSNFTSPFPNTLLLLVTAGWLRVTACYRAHRGFGVRVCSLLLLNRIPSTPKRENVQLYVYIYIYIFLYISTTDKIRRRILRMTMLVGSGLQDMQAHGGPPADAGAWDCGLRCNMG